MVETILMIGGGQQEVKAANSIKSAGYMLAVSDRNPQAPCKKYADYFLNFDGNDAEGIIKHINRNRNTLKIAGVFTLTELVTTVSKVAKNLGLPAANIKSTYFCQDKSISKRVWLENAISTPNGGLAETKENASQLFSQFNEDIFVKPVIGYGGIGSSRITNREDFLSFISNTDLSNYLIEEFCAGKMIDVNGYFDKNEEFHPLGCFEREFKSNEIIENIGVYPCQYPRDIKDKAYALTESACRTLGISWGPVKSDLVLTKNGMKVFEVAPRLHGPKGTLYLSSIVHEKNHLEMILPLITGSSTSKSFRNTHNKLAGFALIESPRRPYEIIEGIDELKELGYEVLLLRKSSKEIITYSKSSDVIGYIFAGARNKQMLDEKLAKACNIVSFK